MLVELLESRIHVVRVDDRLTSGLVGEQLNRAVEIGSDQTGIETRGRSRILDPLIEALHAACVNRKKLNSGDGSAPGQIEKLGTQVCPHGIERLRLLQCAHGECVAAAHEL